MDVQDRVIGMANAVQERRAQLLAEALLHEIVWNRCPDCTEAFPRRKGDHVKRCPACAWRRQVGAGLAGNLRAGECYERSVLAQLRYWRSEAERLGLDPDPDD